MRVFGPLYERAIAWSRHPKAPTFLGLLSFIEAIIFPVPPEVMLAPMTLAQPRRWWHFATISLFWSLVGAFVGYALGMFFIGLVEPWIERLGQAQRFAEVRTLAAEQGFWLLLIGGFTPIPFKLLTLASGAVGMPLLPFFAGAVIGRGKRVYLVTGLIALGGDRAERWLHKYVEPLGWGALALLAAIILGWWWLR